MKDEAKVRDMLSRFDSIEDPEEDVVAIQEALEWVLDFHDDNTLTDYLPEE